MGSTSHFFGQCLSVLFWIDGYNFNEENLGRIVLIYHQILKTCMKLFIAIGKENNYVVIGQKVFAGSSKGHCTVQICVTV